MSIAVSAIVHPSRLLLTLIGAMSLIAACVGIAIALGAICELPLMLRLTTAMFSIFLAVFGFYHGIRVRKNIHIDISGVGQIRLTEDVGQRPCRDTNWPHVEENGELVRMMKNSTIWPNLLLLRLHTQSGRVKIVPVLPDSVSKDVFRALAVACRWIASHNDSAVSQEI